ncbi:minor capsid protein [Herbidospora mongoliensis]|uniref:minor capsid protein n=1 Tax=Herbidospora mongoliensis TaxID=688067 RepID=UPI000832BA60|nr:minor capsid protein [Herbidospora mongoliensis]
MAQRSSLKWNGPQVAAAVMKAAEKGVKLAAEHLLEESRKLVPHEEGTLERSGTVSADGLRAAVSYDTPYAIKQHEDLNLKHDDDREGKYLEKPARTQAKAMQDIMAAQIRRAIP